MKRIAAFLIITLFTSTSFAEPVDVYIFSGQSNMAGSPKLEELTAAQRAPLPQARFWNGTAFETYVPGKTQTSPRAERFGPELGFTRRVPDASEEKPVYLIKFAVGGRPLHAGFDHAKWLGEAPGPNRETFYPGDGPKDPNTGKLHRKLLQRVRPALEHLKKTGVDYRIRGVLWMQGEADAKNVISATTYATSLRRWHERVLEDIGAPPCPLVYGQVLPYSPAHERFAHRDEVRRSQANLDRDSGHPDAYSWARMVPTEDMPLMNDTVHYNAEGQINLGAAFAAAMAKMRATTE
jgi:hypothetical protein